MIFAASPGRLAPFRRLSWQGSNRLLVLIHAQMFSCLLILSRFFRLSTIWSAFLKQGGHIGPTLLVTVSLGRIAVDAALKELVITKFQQLKARNRVKGDHALPGIHPNPPDPVLLLFSPGQCDRPPSFSFYAKNA